MTQPPPSDGVGPPEHKHKSRPQSVSRGQSPEALPAGKFIQRRLRPTTCLDFSRRPIDLITLTNGRASSYTDLVIIVMANKVPQLYIGNRRVGEAEQSRLHWQALHHERRDRCPRQHLVDVYCRNVRQRAIELVKSNPLLLCTCV